MIRKLLLALSAIGLIAAGPAPTPPQNGGTGVSNPVGSTLTLSAPLGTTGTGTKTFAFPTGTFSYTFPGSSVPLVYQVSPFVDGNCVKASGTAGGLVDAGACSGGGSGINQLTGDVLAGPGTGSQAATVDAIGGKAVTLGAALTTTGSSAPTFAFGNGGAATYTYPGVTGIITVLGNTVTGTGGTLVEATAPTIASPVITGAFTATGLVTNTDLANSGMTIAGHLVALGGSQALALGDLTGYGTNVLTALGNPLNGSGGLLGFSLIGTSGPTIPLLNGNNTWAGSNTFRAATTGGASINLPQGTAPTSPANGDLWATTSGFFGRIAGATVGPFGTGGGSVSITAANSCVVVTPSPITGTGTVGLAVTDNSKTTSYSVAAADMCNALNLTAITGTPTLTLPVVSSTVFQPGMSVTIAVTGTVNWTVTNTSGLTLSTGFPTTLYPGMNGTIVANADGTHLDWFGSPVGSATVAGVYKVDGTTILATAGVLSSTGGGGGLSCDAGFTGTLGQCVWTQTANNTATFLAWTGLIRDRYTLTCDGLKPVSSTSVLEVQYGDGAGPSWHTGATAYTINEIYNTGTVPVGATPTANGFSAPYQSITSGTLLSNYSANFFGLAGNGLAAVNKSMLWQSIYVGSGSGLVYVSGGGIDTTSTAAITAIRLIDGQATPANINSGSCTLRQNG